MSAAGERAAPAAGPAATVGPTGTAARYLAIITDGNGRWAQARGLPVNEGHSAGADTVKARLRDCAELGIEELTVYSFSTEKDPAWHYHQFLDAPLTILQYAETKQSQADAPIVWPRSYATVPYTYKKPGT